MSRPRRPPITTPALDLGTNGAAPPGRLARVLHAADVAVGMTEPPRLQLTLMFRADTARRLRDHCAATNQELSGWVDRAVAAALDSAGIGTPGGKPRRRRRPK